MDDDKAVEESKAVTAAEARAETKAAKAQAKADAKAAKAAARHGGTVTIAGPSPLFAETPEQAGYRVRQEALAHPESVHPYVVESYTQQARRLQGARPVGPRYSRSAGDPLYPAYTTPEGECHDRRELMVKLANEMLGDPNANDVDRAIAEMVVRQTQVAGDRKLPPPGYADQGGGPPPGWDPLVPWHGETASQRAARERAALAAEPHPVVRVTRTAKRKRA